MICSHQSGFCQGSQGGTRTTLATVPSDYFRRELQVCVRTSCLRKPYSKHLLNLNGGLKEAVAV